MKSLADGKPEILGRIWNAGSLALLLDYDGTLAPIARHPSKALLPAATSKLLGELSREKGVWIAVVSGRALKDVRRMAGIRGICYVGNHGLELEGPKLRHVNSLAQKCKPVLKRIRKELEKAIAGTPGVWVEDKGLTLSLHFRQATPARKELARAVFYEVLRPHLEKKEVRVTAGKQVFEVRPPVHWTKGTVVRWLLARRAAFSAGPVLPVYIGDDLTDEDAFEALGKQAVTVLVGLGNPLSKARYYAASPAEVGSFLRWLLWEWKLKRSGAERGADRSGRRD